MCPAFSFSLGLGRFLTVLLKASLRFFLRATLLSLVFKLSSLTSLRSKSLTMNLVGMTWFWLTYLTKGLTLVFLMNFFLLSVLLTRGRWRAIPATRRWGNLCFWLKVELLCCPLRRPWQQRLSFLRICLVWEWRLCRFWSWIGNCLHSAHWWCGN